MRKSDFKDWLIKKYPNLQKVTIETTVSDAFYIFTHNIGVSFNDIMNGSKTLGDYKKAVETFLIKNGKIPGTRPSGYASHFKYLVKYVEENGLSSIGFQNRDQNTNHTDSVNLPKEDKYIISKSEIDDVYNKVHNDLVYGRENKALSSILKKYPKHTSLEEVICKISVIDVTHSTHVGIQKKRFSLVDLANQIMSIKDIDKRIQNGDLSLVEEIADLKGVNLLSFASKYCVCHNQMVYGNDDYFKFDSVVSKAIRFKGRSYSKYSEKLNKIIDLNGLGVVDKVREKIDLFFWYNNNKFKKNEKI